jgi:hypothetical protein
MEDVEEFGGIVKLAEALDLLREHGQSVLDLFDSPVNSVLQRISTSDPEQRAAPGTAE